MTLMEVSSTPVTSIFSLHVLIILGITVALVGAVTVILYNKIQQQGEKLSAVMELSAVLAQEVRSHDTLLKHLHSRDPPSQQYRHTSSSLPSPPLNIVFNASEDDPVRVYVSDGSGSSDDDESVEEVPLNISQIPSTTLDTMLMNPMCFGHGSGTAIDDEVSDSEECDSDDESNIDDETDDDTDDESCDTLSVLSNHLESVIDLDEEDVEEIIEINISDNSPSEKRVITLSDISIDASNEEVCSEVHKVVVDSGDNVLDYKKLNVNELRRLAVERKLLDKGSKMKKGPLVDLLTNV
jgi:hypothetical protein